MHGGIFSWGYWGETITPEPDTSGDRRVAREQNAR